MWWEAQSAHNENAQASGEERSVHNELPRGLLTEGDEIMPTAVRSGLSDSSEIH